VLISVVAVALKKKGATAGSGVIAIAAAGSHNLALKSNGTVVAWGDNAAGQNNIPAGLSGVTAIAAGAHHSLALKNDGTVLAWGCGVYNNGQCTVPTGLSGVVAIGGGHIHSLALAAVVPAGGVAASAAVSVGAAQSATPTLEGFTVITESVPMNAPAVEAPVDAAQPLTTTEVAAAPAVATTAPGASGQSQRLFLPLVANLGTMAAGDDSASAPITEAAPQSAAVTTTVAATLTQPVTTTTPVAVITTSVPVSVAAVIDAAPVVTASEPVSDPVTVASAPVITESAPVAVAVAPVVTESVPVSVPTTVEAAAVVTESVPTAVEAVPAVTDTLLLTTTQPITTDAAATSPLAGTAVSNQSGLVVLALVALAVAGGFFWQRRRSRTS